MNLPITAEQIRLAAKNKGSEANLNSVLTSLDRYAVDVGLDRLHRLVHYLAQLMHESGSFKWDQEIWGPTPAQQRYDTRTDLGNTPEKDGDGHKYRGRGPIQLTGKANYASFREWCRERGYNCPDFVKSPDAVNTDPWEGLVPICYWTTRNLNQWADQNDIETITRKINGGKNGLADRMDYYGRLALVVCGYGVSSGEVERFQRDHGLAADGDVGPKTRAALHTRLVALGGGAGAGVRSAPVVEETIVEKEVTVSVPVDRPVVPAQVEKEVRQKTNWVTGIFGTGGIAATALTWLAGMDRDSLILMGVLFVFAMAVILLGGEWIIRRVKALRREIEGV
ncbi:putative chitinase [Pseudorhizobium tarimense]|uniref:Chitinase n=1 Tax=Pseudorhizobium tarimense TaxID=1079109 RepID=A0ABV2H1X0_9HYPH|nr:peptidoglycan-binding protein [Pseudorhizobium tarimense]MCJ8517842.1 peptidoglycan-binding protein [Pseudorhizobium tarimense]